MQDSLKKKDFSLCNFFSLSKVSKEATTKDEAVSKTPANSTPDYAAGLNPATPAAALPPPTYAPPTPTPIQVYHLFELLNLKFQEVYL